MSKKQIQKAKNGSQQVQIQNCTIKSGIEEKRAREIFREMFEITRKDLTCEAYAVATQRVTQFEKDLISKMQKIDGAMSAFADPSFQFLLTNANKTAASTECPDDYSLLSELLIYRIQNGSNRSKNSGINRAVEIVNEITDEALLGLTVAFAIGSLRPTLSRIHEGLNLLEDIFSKLCYDVLPLNIDWLDHLDILDAIRISSFGKLKDFDDYYSNLMHGYCSIGIKRDSDNYVKAVDMLKKSSMQMNMLITHELNDGYVRLPVVREQDIDHFALFTSSNNNTTRLSAIPLTDEQKRTLHEIYSMYDNDIELKKIVHTRFYDELMQRPYLKKIREWWSKIPVSFSITSVGRVLAHANAKRCDRSIPDLDDN